MDYRKQKTEWIFPVPLWPFGLPDCEEVNRRAEKRVYELASEQNSRLASNEGGWHSAGNLRDDPAFGPIINFIDWAVREIAEESDITYKDYNLFIWANLNRPTDYNATHDHPGCHLSGVYYVKLPEGDSGHFRIYNPILYYDYHCKNPTPPYQQPRVELKGREGGMIVFRSPMLHDVTRNNTEEDRISLAFNVTFTR
jgi:uncharacterized protein (TIGR02466 family)